MTPASSVRVCRTCGRSIPAETEFCPHCGARSERPKRSPFGVLLDWIGTAFVLVLVLLFGLLGACFLLGALRGIAGTPYAILWAVVSLAIGIGLLMAAGRLIKYLRRRREALK